MQWSNGKLREITINNVHRQCKPQGRFALPLSQYIVPARRQGQALWTLRGFYGMVPRMDWLPLAAIRTEALMLALRHAGSELPR